MNDFELATIPPKSTQVVRSLDPAKIFANWKGTQERWQFIAPHDDDIILGAGLLLQLAQKHNIPTEVLITTNGQMGYCEISQKESIGEIRKKETDLCYGTLGIDQVEWLNFPDCDLMNWAGRRVAQSEDTPHQAGGFTGLQNAYTHAMRRFRPTRIFLPTGNDLHTDHKMVFQETQISVFHASGDIWPELGKPLKEVPHVYEMAIYCDFEKAPDIQLTSSPEILEKKIQGILAYQSQKQIEKLVDTVRKSGPVEYFRDLVFDLYDPSVHSKRFQS